MLGYLLRTMPVLLRARAAPERTLVSHLSRRVALRQVDINRHMNQAAYAEAFEYGRLDWVLRSGAWSRWSEGGVRCVVAEQRIVYRRELKPLARYDLDTRAVRVEGRLLVIEGHVLVGDRVHTLGEVRMIFIGPDGVLKPEAVPPICEGLLTEPLQVEGWRVVR